MLNRLESFATVPVATPLTSTGNGPQPISSSATPLAYLPRRSVAIPDRHVHLNPPKLGAGHVDPVACERPMRDGTFRVDSEMQGERRLVVHNYGHGGSGWTLAPGSVAETLRLFDVALSADGTLRQEPIRIIGGGVIGLWTAIGLAERGAGLPISVCAESYAELPSHKAGGLLAPVSLKTAPEFQPILDRIGQESFGTWAQIAAGVVPWAQGGAKKTPVYVGLDTDGGLDSYVAQGLMPAPEPVQVHFEGGASHTMRRYETMFLNPRPMMAKLRARAESLGVTFAQGRVKHFNDCEERVIFNCSGMGSKRLAKDDKMIKVNGHLFNLRAQPDAAAMNYMVYTKFLADAAAGPVDDYVYFMPKGEGTLGGTFIPGDLADAEHAQIFADVLDRGQKFFYGA